MKRKTISVRLETRKKRKDADLDVDRWQIAYIREGIRQADAGEFASEARVAAAFARRRK
jgi:predicted transcriptional regulator